MTTGAAVWAHLQEEAYRDNWALWPGTEQLYPGTEPHGMLLTTYTNETARDALFEDYNPDHDDWLFAKYNGPQGEVEAFGRADGCQACHQGAETGYIYTSLP